MGGLLVAGGVIGGPLVTGGDYCFCRSGMHDPEASIGGRVGTIAFADFTEFLAMASPTARGAEDPHGPLHFSNLRLRFIDL
jgi:hypothetical protein